MNGQRSSVIRPGHSREPWCGDRRQKTDDGRPYVKDEGYRQSIHLATIVLPFVVWIAPRDLAIGMLAGLALLAVAVEWARFRIAWVRGHFVRLTGAMLRPHEHTRVAGATYMVVAYLLAVVLFPRSIAVAAMLYNALGDAAAALVGRRWGRHRASWGKSLEGAAAALGVCLAVGALVPGVPIRAAVLGAVFAAGLEFLPLPVDDNLRVTLGGGLGAWLGLVLA
jgi:dolichol kinase